MTYSQADITVPYAVANFAEIRHKGYYYVDKTNYIPTEQPAVIVPPTTQEANGKDPSPKTGDTMPLYPVISLLLVSFAGIVTLYIRRRKKI